MPAIFLLAATLALASCADENDRARGVDPTPERLNDSPSQAFEAADIERANNASEAVRDYCSGAVSEAQYVGCLSHVNESEIP